MNLAQIILVAGLRVYRTLVSPLLSTLFGPMGLGCRFTPTCSCYAIEAVRIHGAMRGFWLAACRVGRCHPWGGQGDDPVPPGKAENFAPSPASQRNSHGTAHETARGRPHSPPLKRDAEIIRTTPQLISSLHGS